MDTRSTDMPLADALGEVEHEWHAKDDSEIWCTYGHPKGVLTPIINAALGPANAANQVMQVEFRALVAIRTWCGKRVVPLRSGELFEQAVARFGTDVAADARYQNYVVECLQTLWPTNRDEADLPQS